MQESFVIHFSQWRGQAVQLVIIEKKPFGQLSTQDLRSLFANKPILHSKHWLSVDFPILPSPHSSAVLRHVFYKRRQMWNLDIIRINKKHCCPMNHIHIQRMYLGKYFFEYLQINFICKLYIDYFLLFIQHHNSFNLQCILNVQMLQRYC